MLSEDQYMERTPDLITKIRRMREAAEKEMNRFTRVTDYDVRRVVGQKQKTAAITGETVPPSPALEWSKKSAAKSSTAQTLIEFGPESRNDGEDT